MQATLETPAIPLTSSVLNFLQEFAKIRVFDVQNLIRIFPKIKNPFFQQFERFVCTVSSRISDKYPLNHIFDNKSVTSWARRDG